MTLAITFIHTAILGAAAAAVIPVIIHLMMRTKPRRVTFPALRFVRQTHTATVKKNRIKHLILLAMRMGAIALLAMVLARPMIETTGLGIGSAEPVSAVVIVDTSGSMAYQLAGQTRLEQGKALAGRLLKEMPASSEAAAIWPDRPAGDIPLSRDLGYVTDQIAQLTDAPGAEAGQASTVFRTGERSNMIRLLEVAYATLEKAAHAKREIYIISDRTADSWPDLGAGRFADHSDTTVFLLDLGPKNNQDFVLASSKWESQVLSPRRAPLLTVAIKAGELTGERVLELVMDDQTVGRSRANILNKFSSATLRFDNLPPLSAGLHTGEVRITDADQVLEDNVRYLALEVGPLPQVILIESPAAGGSALSLGDLVEAVLAPPQAPERARVELVRVRAEDFLLRGEPTAASLDRAHAVVMADVGVLGAQQWDGLKNYVGGGGTLIVLTGPGTDPRSIATSPSAQAILPVKGLGQIRQPAAGTTTAFPDFNKSAVLETYRQHDRKPLLDREMIVRYWSVQGALPPGAVELLKLGGGESAPLLLERPFGSGRTLMLLTNPAPSWSEWTQLSPTWPSLMFSMAMTYSRGVQGAYHFTLDEPAGIVAPSAFRAGSATVELPHQGGRKFFSVNPATGALSLPTDRIGQYRVTLESTGGEKRELVYAVNFDPAEYVLAKMPVEDLSAAFPPKLFVPVADISELERGQAAARSSQEELGAMLALSLLLLLVGESFFSNRFYRRPPGAAHQAAAPTGKGQTAAEPQSADVA